eukprot:NODE_5181_length_1800_cov_4.056784.p1 GENE.NODE_5181_length_1800_cov_4.056784~~NODE_5181_length_1800_cov_4.056784.p1  ORF type:complete len:519 (-),score=117.10 NODE_5181_length_1800_cov_4.056784:165-1721(-)
MSCDAGVGGIGGVDAMAAQSASEPPRIEAGAMLEGGDNIDCNLGARRRASTPQPRADLTRAGCTVEACTLPGSDCDTDCGVDVAGGSIAAPGFSDGTVVNTASSPPSRPGRLATLPTFMRFVVLVTALCAVLVGIALLLKEDTRAQRIALFRTLLKRTEPALPPRYWQLPPEQLRATWVTGAVFQHTFEFNLSLHVVPLSETVLSARAHAGDVLPMPWLPLGDAADEVLHGIPEGALTSRFYRAVVPLSELLPPAYSATDGVLAAHETAMLEVFLPDDSKLLYHEVELVRWRHPQTRAPASQTCQASGADSSSCIERHVIARLCYALPSEGAPWHGAGVSDCEYGASSPAYAPLPLPNAGEVEVLVRGSMDAYRHASMVTKGCSSCHGRLLGEAGPTGSEGLACSRAPEALPSGALAYVLDPLFLPGWCFGQPGCHMRAAAFTLLGIGFALLALFHRLHSPTTKAPEGRFCAVLCRCVPTAMSLLIASGTALAAAVVVYCGLPAIVRRLVSGLLPAGR